MSHISNFRVCTPNAIVWPFKESSEAMLLNYTICFSIQHKVKFGIFFGVI